MAISDKDQLGLVNRFLVKVIPGNVDLGSWSKADGLEVSFEMAEYRTGDHWNHRWYFPGFTKYPSLKLSRGANKTDTKKVKDWLDKTATKFEVGDIKVTLHDAHHDEVADWTLKQAVPVKWAINSFDASASQVAIEVLEITHNGFLKDEVKG